MRVLALTKYGTLAASTRQRFQLYERSLNNAGIELAYAPLFDNDYLDPVLKGKAPPLGAVLRGYLRRLRDLVRARRFDVLWVHCEFFPYLPGAAEHLAQMVAGRPILYDYDDAIFHMYDASPSKMVRRLLSGKLEPLLRSASACSCGNAYLRDYAARFCPHSMILPTVVDTDSYRPALKDDGGTPVIGWIGSPSTWADVRPLLHVIEGICLERRARFRVVGAGIGAEVDRFDGMELVNWTEAGEIAEVQNFDIGIMPVRDLPFQRGKSGYKLVQYMACGLPVIASPVGVNSDMVEEGSNGFLATSPEEWGSALSRLVGDPSLRISMGKAGLKKAERDYSLRTHAPRLIELLRSVAGPQ